jgi:hypothetical protein
MPPRALMLDSAPKNGSDGCFLALALIDPRPRHDAGFASLRSFGQLVRSSRRPSPASRVGHHRLAPSGSCSRGGMPREGSTLHWGL